jgi:hypothetical protein
MDAAQDPTTDQDDSPVFRDRTIRCLVIADAQSLMDDHAGQPSSPSDPILLSPEELAKRVYVVVSHQGTLTGQSGLDLEARDAHRIWWSATSLTADTVAFTDLVQLEVTTSPSSYIRGPFRRGPAQWTCTLLGQGLETLTWRAVLGVGWIGADSGHTPSLYIALAAAAAVPAAPPPG